MCVVRNGGVSRSCRHCIDSRNALEPHMYTAAIRCSRDASIVDALSQTEQLEQAERPRNFRVAYMECARARCRSCVDVAESAAARSSGRRLAGPQAACAGHRKPGCDPGQSEGQAPMGAPGPVAEPTPTPPAFAPGLRILLGNRTASSTCVWLCSGLNVAALVRLYLLCARFAHLRPAERALCKLLFCDAR